MLRSIRARISRRPAGAQQARVEQDALAERLPEQRLAVVRRQAPAAAGRIEQRPAGGADDEMAGHADPLQPQAEPPADFELDDGERDRQPDPALDDPVELAVADVVVLGGARSAEPGLACTARRAACQHDFGPSPRSRRARTRFGQGVEGAQRRVEVEVRPAVGRDAEGPDREVDLGVRARDEPRESRTVRGTGDLGWAHRPIVAPRLPSVRIDRRSASDVRRAFGIARAARLCRPANP